MENYKVIIEEVISEEFSIEAQTPAEAENRAIEKYKRGELVLSPGNVEKRKVAIVCDNEPQWTDF